MSYSIGIVDTLIYGGNIMKIKYLILALAALVPGIIPMEKNVLGKRAVDSLEQINEQSTTKAPKLSSQYQNIHPSEPETRYKCNYCNNWFTKDSLGKHMAEIHGKLPLYSSEEKNNSVQNATRKTDAKPFTKPFKCTYCHYENRYRGNLDGHIRENHSANRSSLSQQQNILPKESDWILSLQSKVIPIQNAFIKGSRLAPIKTNDANDNLLSIPMEHIHDMQSDLFNDQNIPSEKSEKNIDAKLTNEDEDDLLNGLNDALEEDSSDCGGTTETASSPDIITSKDIGNPISFELPVELPDSFDDRDMLSEKNLDAESKDLLEELDDALEDSYESGSTTETASSPDTIQPNSITSKDTGNPIPSLIANVLSTTSANENKKIQTIRGLYKCDYTGCDKIFEKQKLLNGHKKRVHEKKNYSVPKALTKSGLTKHAKKHHEKRYECMLCNNYSTKHRSNLDYHQKTEHQHA